MKEKACNCNAAVKSDQIRYKFIGIHFEIACGEILFKLYRNEKDI